MTKFPRLFEDLCVEFSRGEIKQRKQAGRTLDYVTARTVMNRLDTVLGPENWVDEYTPGEHSVACRLTITLPDGSKLTKCDAGGYAGMADEGDDDKSGYSDAFKRAAVKFGVGRHLYGDGVPFYATDRRETVDPSTRELDQYIVESLEAAEVALTQDGEVVREMPVNSADILRHLYMWAIEQGILKKDTPKPETLRASRNLLNTLYHQATDKTRERIVSEVGRFIAERLTATIDKKD